VQQMTNYQQQANELLSSINVTFSAKFIKHDYHFADDKQERDIFTCTFKRNKTRFSIKFGQSINNSTGNGDNLPTAYDVITCLQKYEIESFENFCLDFGYDQDSRKAYKVYMACCNEYDKVSKFFSCDEIELLQEIQ